MENQKIGLMIAREMTPVFGWIFSVMEKARERLEQSCNALKAASIAYAVIGSKKENDVSATPTIDQASVIDDPDG